MHAPEVSVSFAANVATASRMSDDLRQRNEASLPAKMRVSNNAHSRAMPHSPRMGYSDMVLEEMEAEDAKPLNSYNGTAALALRKDRHAFLRRR